MKVTIITVCKNSAKYIDRCIQSVLKQSYGDIEYILVDGKSTDGTLDVINKYKDDIDLVISEEDTGIYNAMNKGLKYSNGDILYFLNSDDCFYDNNVVSDVLEAFRNKESAIIYGDVIIEDGEKLILKKHHVKGIKYFLSNTICFQAIFIQRFLFEEIGCFNEQYFIYSDVDWLLRVFKKYPSGSHHIERTICYYSNKGVSSSTYYYEKYIHERLRIMSDYFFRSKLKLKLKSLLNLAK
ncbi:glycosyltransferase family 2 protein [Thermodesulfobacteriota bacterium]